MDSEKEEEDDNWGPKTAAVPETELFDSKKMQDILDVGDFRRT